MLMHRDAVLDLPLRLMVVMTVLALSMPMAFSVLETQEASVAAEAMETEASRLMNMAVYVHLGGEGSSAQLELSLPMDCTLSVGGLRDTAESYSISYLYKGEEVGRMYLQSPLPPLVTDGPLLVSDGMMVRMECTISGGDEVLVVSI